MYYSLERELNEHNLVLESNKYFIEIVTILGIIEGVCAHLFCSPLKLLSEKPNCTNDNKSFRHYINIFGQKKIK